jgi:SanA protein
MITKKKFAQIFGVFTALTVGFVVIANVCVTAQGRGSFATITDVPEAPVAMVLGAAVYPDGHASPVLVDRLTTALHLYQNGIVRTILVTGDNGSNRYDEVTVMRDWLYAHGVNPKDVVRDHAGFRTLDSMVRAVRVFRVRKVIVCTQKFHMARSLFLARHAGLEAVGAESDLTRYHGAQWFFVRELVARSVAFLDVYVTHRGPRYLGPEIPIAS